MIKKDEKLDQALQNICFRLDETHTLEAREMLWRLTCFRILQAIEDTECAKRIFEGVEVDIMSIMGENEERETNAVVQDALSDYRSQAKEFLNTL